LKSLRLTLFVLLLMALGGQLVRHSYVRWFEPRQSVLDKYDSSAKAKARAAQSLGELDRLYGEALAKEKAEANVPEGSKPEHRFRPDEMPATFELKSAIEQWEHRERDIRELRFFFGAGVLALVLAFACERLRMVWASVALGALAFCEMLWWTSVSWRSGLWQEYDRLLDNKLVLTLLAVLLLWLSRYRGPLSTRVEERHA
jgi:hypothetical protein